MKKLLSFHNDPLIKEKYVNRLKEHYKLDEIVKGVYWENGKGCAVGCTVHSNKHDDYESELGITWRLALLEDSLFEKLPNMEAKEFPLQFLESMPVGIDTNLIFKKFIIWNLSDEKEGLIYHIKDKEAIILLKEISDTYIKSAYAYAYAYAYASASAYAYAEWKQKFDERIIKMRDKLLELIKEATN